MYCGNLISCRAALQLNPLSCYSLWLSPALPRCSGVSQSPLSASGIEQIFLWWFVSVLHIKVDLKALLCWLCVRCNIHLISLCVCYRPSSLDAYVFGHLAPLIKIRLPNCRMQQNLKNLDNLNTFCCNILSLYFPSECKGETNNHNIKCLQRTKRPLFYL